MSVMNGSASGFTPDNVTLEQKVNGQAAILPANITAGAVGNITYSGNTTLSQDVYAVNVTINNSVTVTTAGYQFYCSGTFTNNGTITTGAISGSGGGSGTSAPGASYTSSYGGSGGGGGQGGTGGTGGATLAAGGTSSGGAGGNGATPSAPTLTNAAIITMYTAGMASYLNGGGGGGSGGTGAGGNSSYGLYIQATSITAGTINAGGANGTGSSNSGGGGGGGGCIMLIYTGTYTAGTVTVTGGTGGGTGTNPGGNGGAGQLVVYKPASLPTTTLDFDAASSNGLYNFVEYSNYTTQTTTSTTAVTIQAFSLTPLTTGYVQVTAKLRTYNNTTTDGVTVQIIKNGSTVMDSATYTQEGLGSNLATTELYFTDANNVLNTPITYALQLNAVTGGTAGVQIQSLLANEVY